MSFSAESQPHPFCRRQKQTAEQKQLYSSRDAQRQPQLAWHLQLERRTQGDQSQRGAGHCPGRMDFCRIRLRDFSALTRAFRGENAPGYQIGRHIPERAQQQLRRWAFAVMGRRRRG